MRLVQKSTTKKMRAVFKVKRTTSSIKSAELISFIPKKRSDSSRPMSVKFCPALVVASINTAAFIIIIRLYCKSFVLFSAFFEWFLLLA